MKRFLPIWGVLMLLLLLGLNLSGATLFSSSESRPEPRSVRDHPGAYRTHFFGGK